MTVRESIIKGQVSSDHVVQFFDSDESRAACVATFLAEGYRAGERLFVVARRSNWAAIVAQLETMDVPVQQAIAGSRLIGRDADDTLRRLSRKGSPDAMLFDEVVGGAVADLQEPGGRVRIYGEMVDMLAQRGELRDAIRLETLWNDLGERTSYSLMCGYSAAHFVSSSTHRAMRDICGAHSCVHRHANDQLASWLLTAAHNRPETPGSATALQN
ncbi:MAG TPA: MEDS domain-containing protein [Vicinamibacterales bacterium]|nr:MEDS domain-containing protein [Vicinamibacterales bacterium]